MKNFNGFTCFGRDTNRRSGILPSAILLIFHLLLSIPAAAQKFSNHDLLFVENKGQIADSEGNLRPDIVFAAQNAAAKLWLSKTAIHYQFTTTDDKSYRGKPRAHNYNLSDAHNPKQTTQSTHRFSVQLLGSNPKATVIAESQHNYTENYYLAHCPDGILDVKSYRKIIYKNVYPKIDWIIYSKGGFMKYDFLIHPGGDFRKIKLKVVDANNVSLTTEGDLLIKTNLGEVREKAPVSFDALGKSIATRFALAPDNTITFIMNAPKNQQYRIDPEIVWATYYGASGPEWGDDTAVDADGNVYLSGRTGSSSGIASGGYLNTAPGDIYDTFLAKFNADGERLWATYYRGGPTEYLNKCDVDLNGNVYLTGNTSHTSGIASGGFQNSFGGAVDGFLVKFSPSGARLWATYYGGSNTDNLLSCAVDLSGNIYISGFSASTANVASGGFQNTHGGSAFDAYLAKFSPDGSRLWATYYGGSGNEKGWDVDTDAAGNVVLCGMTTSPNNIALGGFLNTFDNTQFSELPFVAKFNSSGGRLWGTYYPSGNSQRLNCASDETGNVFISGMTTRTTGVASGGYQNTMGGVIDSFLVKFGPEGTRLWATYFGGALMDISESCAADIAGNIYLSGWTQSTSSIAFQGFQNTQGGGGETTDSYIVKFNPAGTRLWSSYFGGEDYDYGYGCAVNNTGDVYFVGQTFSGSGIASNGFQNSINLSQGYSDAYLVKINGGVLTVPATKSSNSFVLYPNPATTSITIRQSNTATNTNSTSIAIYNSLGQLVMDVPLPLEPKSINISALQAGNYYVAIKSDEGESTLQFIKL